MCKPTGQESSLIMGRDQLGKAQKSDASLTRCFQAAEGKVEGDDSDGVQHFWDRSVLMRKWLSQNAKESGLSPDYQIVLPSGYRTAVLNLLTRIRTWTHSKLFVCTCHCFQTDKVKQDKMNLDKLYIILKV